MIESTTCGDNYERVSFISGAAYLRVYESRLFILILWRYRAIAADLGSLVGIISTLSRRVLKLGAHMLRSFNEPLGR